MQFSVSLFVCFLISGLFLSFGGPTAPKQIPRFVPSKKMPYALKKDQAYRFGYLEVWEDRANPGGKTVKLPVYYFESTHPQAAQDPVVYTVGGPGASTMPSVPYVNETLYPFLAERDVILVEQRGTYFAKPHLDCPEWGKAQAQLLADSLSSFQQQRLLTEAAQACATRLRKKGHNLDTYRTTTIAADLEDLRRVLKIERWNLLTTSYSTKIAQVMMREYPQTIRSVVMDSPLPLAVNYDLESTGNLRDAFDRLLADCAADSACNQAYPALRARFWTYLQERTQAPLLLTVPGPTQTGKRTFRLQGKDLINLFSISSHGAIAHIPAQISALLEGDHQMLIEALASLLQAEASEGEGMGMRISVWCAEELAFEDSAAIVAEQERDPAIKGYSSMSFGKAVCRVWGIRPAEPIENQAVQSEIPVLLLNGTYDPLTPPEWGKAMLNDLPNGQQIVFPGWGHGPMHNWSQPCAMKLIHAFYQQPTQKLSLPCQPERLAPTFQIPEP